MKELNCQMNPAGAQECQHETNDYCRMMYGEPGGDDSRAFSLCLYWSAEPLTEQQRAEADKIAATR